MLRVAAILALLAGPASALGLLIEVDGRAKGEIAIDLFEDVAPNHAERLVRLAREGAYDGVVFHRVIDGFMAQTGDVEFGKADGGMLDRAGTGDSALPNLRAEFSDIPFRRGVVGMARSNDFHSANSQFFIVFEASPHLDGQYTAVGRVTRGMEVVDRIRRGRGSGGTVTRRPDVMRRVTATQ